MLAVRSYRDDLPVPGCELAAFCNKAAVIMFDAAVYSAPPAKSPSVYLMLLCILPPPPTSFLLPSCGTCGYFC